MLTSYHTLLSSFVAVTCTVGTLPGSISEHISPVSFARYEQSLADSKASTLVLASPIGEVNEVAYRGSGRAGKDPETLSNTTSFKSARLTTSEAAHRGSGRITPVNL